MSDPNLENFHGRIGRIEKIHAAGGGFEAAGALSARDFKAPRKRRRFRATVLPLLFLLAVVIALKAAVLSSIGEGAYADRIEALRASGKAGEITAFLVQADPATVWASGQIDRMLQKAPVAP